MKVSLELLHRLVDFKNRPKLDKCILLNRASVSLDAPQYIDVKLVAERAVQYRYAVRCELGAYREWRNRTSRYEAHKSTAEKGYELLDGVVIRRALQDRFKVYRATNRIYHELARTYLGALPNNGWDKLGSWGKKDESE